MSFTGFPPSGLKFLRDLKRHNERPWFDERKATYVREVNEPLLAFVDAVSKRLHAAKIPLAPNPKRPTFRIYRDVRFSNDKTPYNTHVSTALYRGGDAADAGVLYIHIDPKEPFVAAGFYQPETSRLDALRRAAFTHPTRLLSTIAELKKASIAFSYDDSLVRIPTAFAAAAGTVAEPLVKLKSFIVRREIDPKVLSSTDLVEQVATFARASMPFLTWGWDAIDE